jgi:hypothetical protein
LARRTSHNHCSYVIARTFFDSASLRHRGLAPKTITKPFCSQGRGSAPLPMSTKAPPWSRQGRSPCTHKGHSPLTHSAWMTTSSLVSFLLLCFRRAVVVNLVSLCLCGRIVMNGPLAPLRSLRPLRLMSSGLRPWEWMAVVFHRDLKGGHSRFRPLTSNPLHFK